MVMKVRGEEAWRYDTLCALCRGIIGADQEVYVVGAHVFHGECLEKLLKKPRHVFEEILSNLPLDTHEELRKLYYGPEVRMKGKPLTEEERRIRHELKYGEEAPPRGTAAERGKEESETKHHEEKILTREERRKLWDLARKIVNEALEEVGIKQPYEMRVNGLGPEYTKFLLKIRDEILKLVKEPRRVELRVETYGKGFGDTHILIDGEYLYTWRPQFEGVVSSYWGWVRRVYNLLKTLAEMDLLKGDNNVNGSELVEYEPPEEEAYFVQH